MACLLAASNPTAAYHRSLRTISGNLARDHGVNFFGTMLVIKHVSEQMALRENAAASVIINS